MAVKVATKKAQKAMVDTAFRTTANGVQFDVFDLGKVLRVGELIAAKPGATQDDVNAAIADAVAVWRKN